jgi:ATP-dependent RNA helicase SUPV3L1/SUV3
MIEVWRPARSEGRRRASGKGRGDGRRFDRRPGGAGSPDDAARRVAASGAAPGDQAAAAPAAASSETAAVTQPATETPAGEERSRHRRRGGGEQRFDRPRRDRDRPAAHPPRHERREKAPDPNSPFAKLAALKAQLEADAKQRR